MCHKSLTLDGYLGGYCTVIPAGTAQTGTAHCSTGSTENPFGYCTAAQYPIPLWVLCSTRSTHRYCGTAAGTVGTVQYPIEYGTAQYRGTAGGYCTVHKKRSGSPVSFWKYVQNDPGIEPGVASVHGDAITIRPPLQVIMGSLIIGLFTP